MPRKTSWIRAKSLIPNNICLFYLDYRDGLENSLSELQSCIHAGSYEPLYEKTDEWISDLLSESARYIYKEIEEEAEEKNWDIERWEDRLMQEIHERDKSTPIIDLLNNTSKQVMFYDTGHEVDGGSWQWTDAQIRLERYKIKKALNILSNSLDDNDIDMMIRQASYGGELVVYFYDNVGDYINIENKNTISFDNYPHIAIVNHGNGSGDSCQLSKGVKIILPLNVANIFIDKTIKYNYSFAVCGMVERWCETTDVSFGFVEEVVIPEASDISRSIEREKELTAIYLAGGCTPGDMDITRHRNTPYINEFPCGNKCTKCGTFWID